VSASAALTLTAPSGGESWPVSGALAQPGGLVYQGAFRLPGGDVRPQTFAHGGNAMTFNPNGDPGSVDDFPGSLFITGHDRLAYEELSDGSQVAEISIPTPVVADDLDALGQGAFIQGFHDVLAGYFTGLEEIPRTGVQYLDTPATGPRLHLGWGQHLPPETPPATHLWFDPNLAAPDVQGTWYIGDQPFNSVNGYLFEIPASSIKIFVITGQLTRLQLVHGQACWMQRRAWWRKGPRWRWQR
jgi:hypothetical protein